MHEYQKKAQNKTDVRFPNIETIHRPDMTVVRE